ncbi:TPA: hypothetical protein EYN09_05470 [Candidatus Poribacteria bacterium]|nr:hypothetical protein [Candidatus Poribacteria bacterium]
MHGNTRSSMTILSHPNDARKVHKKYIDRCWRDREVGFLEGNGRIDEIRHRVQGALIDQQSRGNRLSQS